MTNWGSIEYEENVMMLYKGALRVDSTDIDTMFEPLSNDIDKIDNTWSNMPFKINDEYFIAIRLVDIDTKALENLDNIDDVKTNDKIWFKPIGCIVLSYNNDYMTHLRYSRNILSLQKDIVEFFKQEFNKESIMGHIIDKQKFELKNERDNQELELEKERSKKLFDILTQISHSYSDFIDIDKKINHLTTNMSSKDVLEKIKIFTNGLKYIFKLGSLVISENSKAKLIFPDEILYTDKTFKNNTQLFLNNLNSFISNYTGEYKLEIEKSNDYSCRMISEEHLKCIIFELIFNAVKHNKSKKDLVIEILIDNAIYIKNNGIEIPKEKSNHSALNPSRNISISG